MNTVELGRLSIDPHGLLYILAVEKVPLAPAELSKLLNASVVFLTRTLSEPMRKNPAAASFSVVQNVVRGEEKRVKENKALASFLRQAIR